MPSHAAAPSAASSPHRGPPSAQDASLLLLREARPRASPALTHGLPSCIMPPVNLRLVYGLVLTLAVLQTPLGAAAATVPASMFASREHSNRLPTLSMKSLVLQRTCNAGCKRNERRLAAVSAREARVMASTSHGWRGCAHHERRVVRPVF